MRERNTDHSLSEKSGENLESGEVRTRRGGVDGIFYSGESLSCRVDLDKISWFGERERGRGLVRREDYDARDGSHEWEGGHRGGRTVEVLERFTRPRFWDGRQVWLVRETTGISVCKVHR